MNRRGDTVPPVFLIDELPPGETGLLTGDEARHAATVRRMRAGERLVLADGDGGLAEAVIDTVAAGRAPELAVRIERRWTEPGPALRVTIVQALAKGDRGELAVELATEAGADRIIPWRAARSVARWEDGPRGDKALGKWRATVRAAAKQARRSHVPEVTDPADTAELARRIAAADATRVLDPTGEALRADGLPESGDLLVVVGPEGGITPEEFDALTAAGAAVTRLGPDVLRTSTAAAVALGALGAVTQRWK